MSSLKKYSSILIKGTAAVSVANASTKVISLLLLPLFTYYLSPEDYGIFAIVTLVTTVLALLYNPGMMSATMRLYHDTEDEEERKELIGSAYVFFFFIPIVPVILSLFFGQEIFSFVFNDFDFYPYGFLALMLAFLSQPGRIWTTLMTLQYKIQKVALYTFISVVLGLIVSAILVIVIKMGAMGRVIGMFPAPVFIFIISLVAIKKYTNGKWSINSIKKQLFFGYPLTPALWAYQGLNLVGNLMLENMSTIGNVGLFSFGITLATLPMILVEGFKQLWNPVFYENMNKQNYKIISQLITYFISGISILCILWILFSKETMLLLINERYYPIIPIIGFIILGIYFNGLLTISNTLLGYNKKFSYTSVFAVISVLINIFLNYILIPKYNILGAALSLAVSYFIFFLLGAFSQRKTLLLIQTKGVTILPILSVSISAGLVFYFSSVFLVDKYSYLEIGLKITFLIIILFLFFKSSLLRYSDFVYIFNVIKVKLKRKSI